MGVARRPEGGGPESEQPVRLRGVSRVPRMHVTMIRSNQPVTEPRRRLVRCPVHNPHRNCGRRLMARGSRYAMAVLVRSQLCHPHPRPRLINVTLSRKKDNLVVASSGSLDNETRDTHTTRGWLMAHSHTTIHRYRGGLILRAADGVRRGRDGRRMPHVEHTHPA